MLRPVSLLVAAFVLVATACAQQAPEGFRWIDFHAPEDQPVVVWVQRSLSTEKWSAIREIAVEYDAALVITSLRNNPQAPPSADQQTVWTVSLTEHTAHPLVTGYHLRLADWLALSPGHPRELGALYDSCQDCAADTSFTAFYYDLRTHGWNSRWMRGTLAAPVHAATPPAGVVVSELAVLLANPDGRQFLATWSHLDYGKAREAEDYLYQYDVDPFSLLDRTQVISGKAADAFRQKICAAPQSLDGLDRPAQSPLCHVDDKPERHPNTHPPANNRGQMLGSHR